jgi:hypothetical protein
LEIETLNLRGNWMGLICWSGVLLPSTHARGDESFNEDIEMGIESESEGVS